MTSGHVWTVSLRSAIFYALLWPSACWSFSYRHYLEHTPYGLFEPLLPSVEFLFAKGNWRGVGERVFWLCVSFHHVIFFDETNNNKDSQRTRSVIPSACARSDHAAAILKRSDVGARAPTSALVFRQLRAAGKQMQCVRCAQHNIVRLWLDGTTAVTIHIHHGAQATCVDRQPPESEGM